MDWDQAKPFWKKKKLFTFSWLASRTLDHYIGADGEEHCPVMIHRKTNYGTLHSYSDEKLQGCFLNMACPLPSNFIQHLTHDYAWEAAMNCDRCPCRSRWTYEKMQFKICASNAKNFTNWLLVIRKWKMELTTRRCGQKQTHTEITSDPDTLPILTKSRRCRINSGRRLFNWIF